MSDDPRDPSSEHVFAAFRQTLLNSISGSTPGQVLSYDATKQRVSVQPMIMHGVDDESENRMAETPPPRHDVPVVFFGASAARITVPILPGDQCLLVQCGSSIAAWKDKGGVIDPVDDRRHDINDCFAVFGAYDSAHLPTDAPTDALVVHVADGIKIKLGGSSGTDATFMVTAFFTAFDTLMAALVTALGVSGGTFATAYGDFKTAMSTYTTSVTEVK